MIVLKISFYLRQITTTRFARVIKTSKARMNMVSVIAVNKGALAASSLLKRKVFASARFFAVALALVMGALLPMSLITSKAYAQAIENPVAAFAGLDKITGRLTKFDVYINETVQFGALQLTPRVCYTRPASQIQRVSVFLEVDEVSLQGDITRIFSGWMFAESPALNAIDHAVYDVWLTGCKASSPIPPPESR